MSTQTWQRVRPAPSMMCLQDADAHTLRHAAAAVVLLRNLKTRPQVAFQYDNPKDEARCLACGMPAPKAFYSDAFREGETLSLEVVQSRLCSMMAMAAARMGVQVYDARKRKDPRGDDNMGFLATLTEYYGCSGMKDFQFHFDTMVDDDPRRPPDCKNYLQVTIVYYLIDPSKEEEALRRPGQGSTLYNLEDVPACTPETEVAYAPLRNGRITLLDGSRFHAVGPNFGLERGAVLYKCFLYTSDTERQQSREAWWHRLQSTLLDMAADPAWQLQVAPPRIMKLSDALRPPRARN